MPMPPMEFSMPMYREYVPEWIRPWIYVFFAIVFQLSGGIYLGSLNEMAGQMSLLREDVLMIGLCGVVGVCMPFPLLFRFKFRYTNRQLLLNAALVIAACNVLCMYVKSIPLLCVISFVAGFLKLCGTFECMSNIQLWMAPGRDFTRFFPFLYIIVLGAQNISPWIAGHLSYYFGGWETMHWFMTGLLLIVALTVVVLTRNVRIMPKLPLISVDWLGCVLWSLVLLQGIWIFTYGEHYNWFDSRLVRGVCASLLVTLWFSIQRMRHIRHPFIAPEAFSYKGFMPILALFFVGEIINSTSLQKVFFSAVLGYGPLTTTSFAAYEFAGTICGCLFVMWWIKRLRWNYVKLMSVGFVAMLAYQLSMYFLISPDANIGLFRLPTVLRCFGYGIFFTALTIYLEEVMPFQHFFMGLTICGFIRNGLVSSMASAGYSYALRWYEADYLTHGFTKAASEAISEYGASIAARLDALTPLMSGVKTLFGWTCLAGCAVLLIFLLFDIEPVRRTFKKMPSWRSVGLSLKKSLKM